MLDFFKYIAPVTQMLIWPICRGSLEFFGRLEISGLENIKDIDHKIIIASNHNTALDPIIIRSSMPFWGHHKALFATSLTKEYYNPGLDRFFYGGLLFKITGAWPIYKGAGDYKKSFVHHIDLLEKNRATLIFPSGTRIKDGDINKEVARPGIIYLADITATSIIPVTITGQVGINVKRFLTRKHKIKINFGKKIDISEIRNNLGSREREDYIKGAENVMGIIHQNIQKITF